MFDRSHAPSEPELVQLLLDAGRQLAYPPVPDFAAAFEMPATPTMREPLDTAGDSWRPPHRPPVSEPSPSIPASRPRMRWTQALRLGGALAAFALVGLTLVLIFRDVGDGEQPNGGATTVPTEPLLIAVGSEGTITALDPLSGEVRYTINGDNQPDAILSPDGTRLYVAGLSLSAHDARTGDEIWRVPYQFRVGTISNVGPSTLAISPDGTRLYIYSYDGGRSTGPTAASVPFFIQTFDTVSGALLGESEPYASGAICAARLYPSPDGKKLYAPCERGTGYRVYELPSGVLATAQPVTGFPRLIATASHGDRLFLVSHSGEFTTQQENLTVIDMREGIIIDQRLLDLGGYAVQGQAVVSPNGSHLYVGVSDTVDDFAADAVLVFDTQTWQQVRRLEPEIPITTRELAVDVEGAVYTASAVYGGTSLATSASTIWRIDPEAGTVEAVAEFPDQEIAHVLTAQVPAAPEPEAAPTTTSRTTEPLLIAVSSEGQVTAIEPETGATRYTINGGYQPDAILSPDGTRLYVAGDDLSAHYASTGEELWRVEYRYRLHWTVDQSARSTLAISPDGGRLYIASYDQERGTSPDANTIPHFIQTFDTATGENLGETEAIRGGCTVPIHPSPDGQRLHAPCDGNYSVYGVPSGSLQPPPQDRATVSASAQHDNELYLVTSSGLVQVVDLNDVTIVSEARLQIDGQVAPGLAALSDDGLRLYIGVSTSSERFFADQVLVFDSDSWHQVAQFSLGEPLLSRDLAVDAEGKVYGASTSFTQNTSTPSPGDAGNGGSQLFSTIWRMNPETGVTEAVARLANQEVAHVLLGYVPVDEPEDTAPPPTADDTPMPTATDLASPTATATRESSPTASATLSPSPIQALPPTPTVDTSAAAIDAALAALPAESKGCQATPGADGDAFGWEIAGVTLIGDGVLWASFSGTGTDYLIPPVQSGRSTSVYWNIGGPDADNVAFVELAATELGTSTQIGPDGPQNAGESPFFDGVMWKTYFTFPHAGCWQVVAERAGYEGVLWLTVEDAP